MERWFYPSTNAPKGMLYEAFHSFQSPGESEALRPWARRARKWLRRPSRMFSFCWKSRRADLCFFGFLRFGLLCSPRFFFHFFESNLTGHLWIGAVDTEQRIQDFHQDLYILNNFLWTPSPWCDVQRRCAWLRSGRSRKEKAPSSDEARTLPKKRRERPCDLGRPGWQKTRDTLEKTTNKDPTRGNESMKPPKS